MHCTQVNDLVKRRIVRANNHLKFSREGLFEGYFLTTCDKCLANLTVDNGILDALTNNENRLSTLFKSVCLFLIGNYLVVARRSHVWNICSDVLDIVHKPETKADMSYHAVKKETST